MRVNREGETNSESERHTQRKRSRERDVPNARARDRKSVRTGREGVRERLGKTERHRDGQ